MQKYFSKNEAQHSEQNPGAVFTHFAPIVQKCIADLKDEIERQLQSTEAAKVTQHKSTALSVQPVSAVPQAQKIQHSTIPLSQHFIKLRAKITGICFVQIQKITFIAVLQQNMIQIYSINEISKKETGVLPEHVLEIRIDYEEGINLTQGSGYLTSDNYVKKKHNNALVTACFVEVVQSLEEEKNSTKPQQSFKKSIEKNKSNQRFEEARLAIIAGGDRGELVTALLQDDFQVQRRKVCEGAIAKITVPQCLDEEQLPILRNVCLVMTQDMQIFLFNYHANTIVVRYRVGQNPPGKYVAIEWMSDARHFMSACTDGSFEFWSITPEAIEKMKEANALNEQELCEKRAAAEQSALTLPSPQNDGGLSLANGLTKSEAVPQQQWVENKKAAKKLRSFLPHIEIQCTHFVQSVHSCQLVGAALIGAQIVSLDSLGNLKIFAIDADFQDSYLLLASTRLASEPSDVTNFETLLQLDHSGKYYPRLVIGLHKQILSYSLEQEGLLSVALIPLDIDADSVQILPDQSMVVAYAGDKLYLHSFL